MKLYQMTNHNGNAWANQIVASFDELNTQILQSYNSKVVLIDWDTHTLDFGDDWDYSKTTMKAVCKFLAENVGGDWNARRIREALKVGDFMDEYGEKWEAHTASDDFFNDFFKK